MVLLIQRDRPIGTYEAEMRKAGRGRLYLFSNRIFFDSWEKGIRFEASIDRVVKFREKKPWFFIIVRRRWGRKTFAFRMCNSPTSPARSLEGDLLGTMEHYKKMLLLKKRAKGKRSWQQKKVDVDSLWESEAIWFECNWVRIMRFLTPQSAKYLNDFIENVRIGSPSVNPYLLVAEYENLYYDDFSDLPGFLNWRYPEMTEREIGMAVSIFRDYKRFTVATLELELELQSKLKNHKKLGRSLFEHVITVSRKIEEYSASHEEEHISQVPWTHVQYIPIINHCNFKALIGSSW